MPPIKLKLNLGALSSSPSTPIAKSAARDGFSGSTETPKSSSSKLKQGSPYTDGLGLRMGSVGAEDGREEDERDGRDDDEAREARPTIRLNISSLANRSGSPSVVSSPSSTPMSVTPVSTPGPSGPSDPAHKRKRGRPKKRPSAIPAHLVTPRTTPRASGTGLSTPMYEMDMGDEDIDPLSLPLSPNAASVYPADSMPDTPTGNSETYEFTPRRTQWKRVKRPFNELANKVLVEIRRKDSYGFFLEPVNIDDYPDYYSVIGGEDKAMDLDTMQNKVNDGVYKGMDEFESDFRKIITAAKAFNLPGTMPFREATKVFNHGMKHIDRSRPLVLTPSPSPSPTQRASALPETGGSTRSTPHPTNNSSNQNNQNPTPTLLEKDVPPKKRIPSDMLAFPPNSLQARAVGWNQTGGRVVRAKRFVRGREKFVGRWRDYCADGSRDIAEMEEPALSLDPLRTRRGDEWMTVVDWPKTRKEQEDWWDWEGPGGPTGQPPLPGAEKLKPKDFLYKEFNPIELGPYPELKEELKLIKKGNKPSDKEPPLEQFEALEAHLRPDSPPVTIPKGTPAQSFINIYERRKPMDFLYNVCLGGVRGEAYTQSVRRFLDGALGTEKEGESEGSAIIREYVAKEWHGGVLQGDLGRAANDAVNVLHATLNNKPPPAVSSCEVDLSPSAMSALLDNSIARVALRELTSPLNPLDLAPLLRDPTEFLYPGIGAKSGVLPALEWISNELQKHAKEQAEGRKARAEWVAQRDQAAKVAAEAVAAEAMRGTVPMDVDVPNGLAGNKRSSAELELEEPAAKRSRVASPVDDAPMANGVQGEQANGHLEPPAPVSTAPTPETTFTPAAPPAPSAPAAPPAPSAPAAPTPAPSAPSLGPEPPTPDLEATLRQLRLELVAVSKFYPLASLKKMSKEQAKQLLPATVRGLMTRSAD